ncbi:protein trichome birefringence-like 34 [Cynara cardunculus var. scolymus]|uniref:PC-Esterase n=1 Tax=Cynara cardunculus var. scolymus TaxID=59895 RepID=A0A118JVY9_CYNCS|nr:protein trichome birefringence-like 34 [Cynara cardunculus var. scolymus]KVH94824.1 PC-Esterase [Cynara cardunculus var. scolymus]
MVARNQHYVVPVTWGSSINFSIVQFFVALLFAVFFVGAVYMAGEYVTFNMIPVSEGDTFSGNDSSSQPECSLFSGKWVFDNESYPLYKEKDCSFMSDQLACNKFGREDLSYQQWRWQPHHCDIPRFNATRLLERLRNKRMVFVGDSLNRGQWVSMVCLLDTSIHDPNLKSMHNNGSNLITFKALGYNASIEFYWAPLLVESNSDDPVNHKLPERIVRSQSIEKHARVWTDADILVFNSYLWWRRPHIKVLWGSFEDTNGIYKEVEMIRSYEMALKTWSDWLEIHVDRAKTQLFFISMSPTHERAGEWGASNDQNCYSETDLITKEGYIGSGTDPKMMKVVENSIDELKTRGMQIEMINITQLSEYRKEGHPSIYRKQWEALNEEQLLKPNSYSDCIHWCLPGVPDVWNELLYAYIFRQ